MDHFKLLKMQRFTNFAGKKSFRFQVSGRILFCTIFLLLNVVSCKSPKSETSGAFVRSWIEWKNTRLYRLKSNQGWLNLAGLYWLNEGVNTFGSDSSNTMVFPPEAPAFAGHIIRHDSLVTLIPAQGVVILENETPVKKIRMIPDDAGNPTTLKMGSLVFFLIHRDARYGIRLRNLNSPLAKNLDSVPSYPPDTNWVIPARFIPFEKPEEMIVNTVVGTTEKYHVPGKLEFTIDGEPQTLLPFDEGDSFFLVFGDATSADETYGGGRFMVIPKPDSAGNVLLDFNRAYNPPCAFTPFATCPLPPKENLLKTGIYAGEKDPHIYAH